MSHSHCLFVYLSISLSLCLSLIVLYFCLYLQVSFIPPFSLCVCLTVCLSVCLSVCLYIPLYLDTPSPYFGWLSLSGFVSIQYSSFCLQPSLNLSFTPHMCKPSVLFLSGLLFKTSIEVFIFDIFKCMPNILMLFSQITRQSQHLE